MHRAIPFESAVLASCKRRHPASEERLNIRRFCIVFENEIELVWPRPQPGVAKRDAAIQAFASHHGWAVTIHDPGIRLTFRKLASGSAAVEMSAVVRVSKWSGCARHSHLNVGMSVS
jgi:hypothetical protein